MKLDKTFANEVRKAANGDGSREHKFALLKELKEASAALSDRHAFESCLKKHGRAKVALCIASTIFKQEYRFDKTACAWARLVLDLWTNRYNGHVSEAIINIHPAILGDKSCSVRKLTVEETDR
jgi:hypothetical protein